VTVAYVKDRAVFGKSLSSFQNAKFVLAECQSHVVAGQAVVDQAMASHERGDEVDHREVDGALTPRRAR
jgi:alkylation response protein AidB-like acyl-CoA dehydrogenase